MRLAWAWMAWAQGSLLCCLGARRVFSHMLASRKAAGAPAWHTLEGLRSGWYFIASLRNARLMSFLLASFFTPSTLYGSSAALWSQHTMHRRIVTCTRKVRRMAECDRRVWQGLAGFGSALPRVQRFLLQLHCVVAFISLVAIAKHPDGAHSAHARTHTCKTRGATRAGARA